MRNGECGMRKAESVGGAGFIWRGELGGQKAFNSLEWRLDAAFSYAAWHRELAATGRDLKKSPTGRRTPRS